MNLLQTTLFNLFFVFILVAAQAPSSPGKYSHVGCYGKLPPQMYNMDGASGHKLLTGNAFTRTNAQAINECFNVAQVEHAEHFGLSMKSCYIQWPSTVNYAANAPSSTCTNGIGSFMAIDVYKNLMYTPPQHHDIFTVHSYGKDFVVLNETSFNYMQSIVSCTNFGMTLAELNTAREISDLKAGLKMKFPNITGKNFWLHMDRSGGTPYTWRTTHLLVPTQGVNQDWANGNPNGVTTPNYDCGAMIGSQDLKWITDNCKSHVNIPICEKNGTKSPTTAQSASPTMIATPSANQSVTTTCPKGFLPDLLKGCVDIDECLSRPCGIGWCENFMGGYNCTCLSGTIWNSQKGICEDVDECLDVSMCVGGKCSNYVRTYACECPQGYRFDNNTRTCVDLDECAAKLDICHFNAECFNTEGHYRCSCKPDFIGDGIVDCHLSPKAKTSFQVTCLPNLMKLEVSSWLIETYGMMTLRDTSCTGVQKSKTQKFSWTYSIRNNLARCGNDVKNNGTHFVYSNVLTNNASVISSSGIISGHLFHTDWKCTFKIVDLYASLSSGKDIIGAGFIDFPLGKVDAKGNYPSTMKKFIQPPIEGIIAQTESPSGALVTDSSGAIVPMTNPDGSFARGPDGGRFVPATDANGLPVTNAQGNIVPETYENGSLHLPPSLPPQLVGSALDGSIYGGKVPSEISPDVLAILEGAQLPGNPVLQKITLDNGTVVIPGLNFSLTPDILHLLPDIQQRAKGGIIISDALLHKFGILNGSGQYSVKMIPFTDDTFRYMQMKTVFTTNDELFIRVTVLTTDSRIAAVVQRCWGTPESNPDSLKNLALIVDGCAVPDAVQGTVNIMSNGETRTADFRTQVFKFDGRNQTFIHCQVKICDLTKELCKPECSKTLNRKRRSTDNVVINKNGIRSSNVTFGPFHVLDSVAVQEKMIIPAIAFITFICLIALISTACCIFFCCRRRHRKKPQEAEVQA